MTKLGPGLLILLFVLVGCSTPATLTDAPMTTYDNHTKYRIDESADGFVIVVSYSRYLGHAESEAVAVECKSALTNIAYDHADKLGKKIETINEQRIKLSLGYSGLSGVGSCSARSEARWLK
jgi:hypothetical protein